MQEKEVLRIFKIRETLEDIARERKQIKEERQTYATFIEAFDISLGRLEESERNLVAEIDEIRARYQ